jgi:hypothetical protein
MERTSPRCAGRWASRATFYRWKQVYSGLIPSEVKKLCQLGEETARLSKMVADLTLGAGSGRALLLSRFNSKNTRLDFE